MKKNKKATILLVDNDIAFIKTRSEYLEQEGYQVIPANNSKEAKRCFKQGGIDLAIVDVRLEREKDDNDISGLILIKETANPVPKIILSGHPDQENIREALRTDQKKGRSPAEDFIFKDEGVEPMLNSVSKILEAYSSVKRPQWLASLLSFSGSIVCGIVAIIFNKASLLLGTIVLGIAYAILAALSLNRRYR